MSAQFRSRFVFKLSAGALYPDKSMSWFCNERYHGKGPMDGVGGTLKNVIFRKVKSGKVVVYTPEEFANFASQFVPSSITIYLPKEEEIKEPSDRQESPAIKVGKATESEERIFHQFFQDSRRSTAILYSVV